MDDRARDEYLSSFDLRQWQKEEVLSSEDVQVGFSRMIDRIRFSDAATAFSTFDQATRSNELFFEPETFRSIRSVCDKMHGSLVSCEIAIDDGDSLLGRQAWDEYD